MPQKATKFFAVGTKFGPYPEEDAKSSIYSLWMELVTETTDSLKSNLALEFLGGKKFYKATKDIQKNEEFLLLKDPDKQHANKEEEKNLSDCYSDISSVSSECWIEASSKSSTKSDGKKSSGTAESEEWCEEIEDSKSSGKETEDEETFNETNNENSPRETDIEDVETSPYETDNEEVQNSPKQTSNEDEENFLKDIKNKNKENSPRETNIEDVETSSYETDNEEVQNSAKQTRNEDVESSSSCDSEKRLPVTRNSKVRQQSRIRRKMKSRVKKTGSLNSYMCFICGKKFHLKYFLELHMDDDHPGARLEISKESDSNLSESSNDSNEVSKHQCKFCQRYFLSLSGLTSHERACRKRQRESSKDSVEENSQPHDIEKEKSLTERIRSCSVQLEKIAPLDGDEYVDECHVCGKKFKSELPWLLHMKQHDIKNEIKWRIKMP